MFDKTYFLFKTTKVYYFFELHNYNCSFLSYHADKQ